MLEDHHSFHHGLRFTCCHCNEAIICQSMNLWCSSMLSATIQIVESCIMKHYPSDAWQIQRKSKKNCQSSYCTLSAIKTDSRRSQMYGNSKHSKCPRPPLSFSENFSLCWHWRVTWACWAHCSWCRSCPRFQEHGVAAGLKCRGTLTCKQNTWLLVCMLSRFKKWNWCCWCICSHSLSL